MGVVETTGMAPCKMQNILKRFSRYILKTKNKTKQIKTAHMLVTMYVVLFLFLEFWGQE